MDHNINTTTALWSPSKARRWLALAAYPLVWAVNRPSAAWLAGAIYDLALRCIPVQCSLKRNSTVLRCDAAGHSLANGAWRGLIRLYGRGRQSLLVLVVEEWTTVPLPWGW